MEWVWLHVDWRNVAALEPAHSTTSGRALFQFSPLETPNVVTGRVIFIVGKAMDEELDFFRTG
jgi:hypothetical protein